MRQIADLHIHSRYSRACSKDLTLENIDKTCRVKGVDIITTGDFTFPDWLKEIKDKLEELKGEKGPSGLYKLKRTDDDKVKFILTTELALIYKKNNKCRRIHLCVMAPNIEAAKKLFKALDKDFNVRSDGRPILGISIENLFDITFKIDPEFIIFPAHIWTPWFSIFGSKSGFDSLEEAFGDKLEHVYAYETGLSSDPEMNWRVSALDRLTLISNSDAHSLQNIAREANVFELAAATYDEVYNVITRKTAAVETPDSVVSTAADKKSYLDYTIEFYPEEGMYHYDGHRVCGIRFSPSETRRRQGICPKCKKPLVIGVEYRVDELADRPRGYKPAGAPGYKKLVELDKIIAEALGVKSRVAGKVKAEYNKLVKNIGTEMAILLDKPLDGLKELVDPKIIEGIRRVRNGELIIDPGYDGEYGKVRIFGDEETDGQKMLF